MSYNEFQQEQEFERQKLLLVELPNVLQRILHLSMIPLPNNKEAIKKSVEDIKKITNTECESALSYFEKSIRI